jgi:hypothetical protein
VTTAEAALVISGFAAVVGAVGAVNAHRALRWQRKRDAERSATRVRLEFEHAAWRDLDIESSALAMLGGPDNLPLEYRLTLVAVNDSETATVYLRDLHIRSMGSPDAIHLTYDESDDTRLEPRQRTSRHIFVVQLPFDPSAGFIGQARLATGELIATPITWLDSHLLSHIERHNSRGRLDAPPADA